MTGGAVAEVEETEVDVIEGVQKVLVDVGLIDEVEEIERGLEGIVRVEVNHGVEIKAERGEERKVENLHNLKEH